MEEKPRPEALQDEIAFDSVKQHGHDAVEFFIEMLKKGESVRMAAMLATRTPPRLGINDHTYQSNKVDLLTQCSGSPAVLHAWKTNYKRVTGEELPDDAVLFRGLAQYPGDPKAVLSHKTSLTEIKEHVRMRGAESHGDWDIERPDAPPKVQEVDIAPDIIERYRAEYIQENPDLAHANQDDLTEEIIDTHSRRLTPDDIRPYGTDDFESLSQKLFGKGGGKAPIQITSGAEQPAGDQPTTDDAVVGTEAPV